MRRENDFYPTPTWATAHLIRLASPQGSILEPCAGEGHIANALRRGAFNVTTNDLDPKMPTDWHLDALGDDFRRQFRPDWIISNPPFSLADQLVPQWIEMAEWGVAMLLRLSWLEPTKARGLFLEHNPPTTLIVLPRISFTGDGHTDSVTTAWFVWDRRDLGRMQRIIIVPRRATQEMLALPRGETVARAKQGRLL